MTSNARRDFQLQPALGTAGLLAYLRGRVLGANNRVRVDMIEVGNRGQDLLEEVLVGQNHVGGILDEPKYATRERLVGAPRSSGVGTGARF